MSTTQGQGWSLEEEVLHLRREVQNQQRRIAALLALVPPSRLVESNNSEESLWLFGYGSLIWNPGSIPFVRKVPAFVQGWKREFRQKSTDHRGTIDAPGRVVTLVPEPDAVCEGMAYEVPANEVEETLKYLDYREKDNYDACRLNLFGLVDGKLLSGNALCYIGKLETLFPEESNLNVIASHISQSVGPSGKNSEYLLKLQEGLARNGLACPHVYEVAARLHFIP